MSSSGAPGTFYEDQREINYRVVSPARLAKLLKKRFGGYYRTRRLKRVQKTASYDKSNVAANTRPHVLPHAPVSAHQSWTQNPVDDNIDEETYNLPETADDECETRPKCRAWRTSIPWEKFNSPTHMMKGIFFKETLEIQGSSAQEHHRFAGDHFLANTDLVKETALFHHSRKVPKGAHLHTHFNANLDPDVLLNIALTNQRSYVPQNPRSPVESSHGTYARPVNIVPRDDLPTPTDLPGGYRKRLIFDQDKHIDHLAPSWLEPGSGTYAQPVGVASRHDILMPPDLLGRFQLCDAFESNITTHKAPGFSAMQTVTSFMTKHRRLLMFCLRIYTACLFTTFVAAADPAGGRLNNGMFPKLFIGAGTVGSFTTGLWATPDTDDTVTKILNLSSSVLLGAVFLAYTTQYMPSNKRAQRKFVNGFLMVAMVYWLVGRHGGGGGGTGPTEPPAPVSDYGIWGNINLGGVLSLGGGILNVESSLIEEFGKAFYRQFDRFRHFITALDYQPVEDLEAQAGSGDGDDADHDDDDDDGECDITEAHLSHS